MLLGENCAPFTARSRGKENRPRGRPPPRFSPQLLLSDAAHCITMQNRKQAPQSPNHPSMPRALVVLGPRSGPKKRVQDFTPASVVDRVILALQDSDLGSAGIARAIGQRSLSGRLKIRIKSLLEDRIIERTFPDNLHNRHQKYRLTVKGRTLAASLAKNALKTKKNGHV